MRHLLVLSSALTLACAAAGGASAQQAQTNGAGLRYLSWPGKPVPARTAPTPQTTVQDTTQPTPRPTQIAAVARDAGRDAALPPLARIDAPPAPRRGLTPATAWTTPTPAPNTAQAYSAPSPQAEAAPVEQPRPEQPAPQVEVQTPPPPAEPQPMAQALHQPQAEAAAEPAPQPAEDAAVVDPMAPRRDAAIFRLQRPQGTDASQPDAQTAQVAQAAQPYPQSARYYSVHRQAGRHPDAIATPQPVYLDALPVEMSQTPASADLAQPDGPPALIRDANGRVRPLPQSEPDTLP